MKIYIFSSLFFLSLFFEIKAQKIPTKTEAYHILQELITNKPIIDYRNINFKAERKYNIGSFFFNKSFVWDFISTPKEAEPIKLLTHNGKKPTPLQDFDFKQMVKRELFLENNNIASQITVKKSYELIKRAIIKNVGLSSDKKYAIIEFVGDLHDLNTPDFSPYKDMKLNAYYNLAKKQIAKITFHSNKTVELPEDPKLSLTSSNGYISFVTSKDKTYVTDVHFLGKIRYYILSFSIDFIQKFNYNFG